MYRDKIYIINVKIKKEVAEEMASILIPSSIFPTAQLKIPTIHSFVIPSSVFRQTAMGSAKQASLSRFSFTID